LLVVVVVVVLVLLLLTVLLSPAPTAATWGGSMISTASGQTIRNACKAFFLS
jgi:preprotein translocase subunit SecG